MVSDGPSTKRYDAEIHENEEVGLRTAMGIEKKSCGSEVRAANNLVEETGADVPLMLVDRAYVGLQAAGMRRRILRACRRLVPGVRCPRGIVYGGTRSQRINQLTCRMQLT